MYNNTGLNKFDWITAGLALVGTIAGLIGVVTGNKANSVRMTNYEAQWKKIPPPMPKT